MADRPDELDCVLPHHVQAPGTARRLTRAALEHWHIGGEAADPILLAVSELVTNAIEHACPPVTLHLHREDAVSVHVQVTDGGPACQEGAWTSSCTDDEHGRGHTIVDFLATAHGARTTGHGTSHWATFSTTV
ncbi:ATP-binding protein [Streptomyces sp. TRM72054]|nr:ATP-binding protein [Streptomyces sp. TRM72054]